jgi:hypothetical protein
MNTLFSCCQCKGRRSFHKRSPCAPPRLRHTPWWQEVLPWNSWHGHLFLSAWERKTQLLLSKVFYMNWRQNQTQIGAKANCWKDSCGHIWWVSGLASKNERYSCGQIWRQNQPQTYLYRVSCPRMLLRQKEDHSSCWTSTSWEIKKEQIIESETASIQWKQKHFLLSQPDKREDVCYRSPWMRTKGIPYSCYVVWPILISIKKGP